MKKLAVFDMDGTLAASRKEKVAEPVKEMLRNLNNKGLKVVILSSGRVDRLYGQIEDVDLHLIGNFGLQEADIVDGELTNIKEDKIALKFTETEIWDKVQQWRKLTGYTQYQGNSVVINETGQIIIPVVGDEADKEVRETFDPSGEKRIADIQSVEEMFPGFEVMLGGKTSYDILDREHNKYNALLKYCNREGYTIDDVIFFGDEYTKKYGNDYCLKLNNVDGVNVDNYKNIVRIVEDTLDKVMGDEKDGKDSFSIGQ